MLLIRAQAKFDESARIRRGFRLPAVVCLVLLHGRLASVVPDTGRFSREVVLANQGFLYLPRTLRVDLLLASAACCFA